MKGGWLAVVECFAIDTCVSARYCRAGKVANENVENTF